MTMLELMLALGLSTIVTYAIFSFYADFTKKLNKISDDVEISTDIESGQRIVLNDLKSIDPSFGILTLLDDRDQKFFEYFPDLPDDDIYPAITDRQKAVERVYTMKWQNGFHDIIFLMLDQKAHEYPSLIYDPSWAFAITKGANWYVEGTVSYTGINSNVPGLGNAISAQRAASANYYGYWNEGQVLLFDTPLLFRPKNVGANANITPPRSVSFLGIVKGASVLASPTNFLPVDRKNMKTLKQYSSNLDPLDSTHPVEGIDIPDAKTFFWDLPAAGGGQPMVRLRPVKLVRYYLEQMYPDATDPEKQKIVRLWKHVMMGGGWDVNRNRFIVAEKLKTVQFKRSTVGEKALLFDISRNELKKGGEL